MMCNQLAQGNYCCPVSTPPQKPTSVPVSTSPIPVLDHCPGNTNKSLPCNKPGYPCKNVDRAHCYTLTHGNYCCRWAKTKPHRPPTKATLTVAPTVDPVFYSCPGNVTHLDACINPGHRCGEIDSAVCLSLQGGNYCCPLSDDEVSSTFASTPASSISSSSNSETPDKKKPDPCATDKPSGGSSFSALSATLLIALLCKFLL
ncbi:hypothetical protein L596_022948 [Steinernema carpocapsae]|nr:hypothetical protein L596_022948 [Steinernema carpocapsae]